MDLTKEEKQVIINLLAQISLPVKDAPTVIAIISKLQTQAPAEGEPIETPETKTT